MDVFPLLQHIEPRTFQGGTRNIPARAEEEDLGAHHLVLGGVSVCLRGRPRRRSILWTHSGRVVAKGRASLEGEDARDREREQPRAAGG